MAELMIRVRDQVAPLGSKDGDVIAALNNRVIKYAHLSVICNKNNAGFNSDGLRPAGSLFDVYLSNIKQYKYERLSSTQVRQTRLSDMTEVVMNDNKDDWLKDRKKHSGHVIFGTTGSEYWYGGRTDASHANLDSIWPVVESQTGLLEINHRLWPWTDAEKRHWLVISTDDFSDDVASEYESSVYDRTDPDNPVMTAKHKYHVDWRNLATISPAVITAILDRSTIVDSRGLVTYTIGSTLIDKTV